MPRFELKAMWCQCGSCDPELIIWDHSTDTEATLKDSLYAAVQFAYEELG
jgi:hypothetical protein